MQKERAALQAKYHEVYVVSLICICALQPAVLTTVPSSCKMVSSSSVAATGRRLQASGMANGSHHITLSSQTVHWGYF